MSSILLSNPFIPPSPATGAQGAVSALAIAPLPAAPGGGGAGGSTSFSGFGKGSDQDRNAALLTTRRHGASTRPADATPKSVINAQTNQPDVNIYFQPFGAPLPKVEMPDPLPTSPFLKRL